MINIIICDDEIILAQDLEQKIKKIHLKEEYSISVCTTVNELLGIISKISRCDILFMDIELDDGIKGTDVAAKLKELYTEMLIVYVSGYSTYYVDMVQAEPFKFLEKPFDTGRLKTILEAALNRLKKSNYTYTYEFDKEVYIVDLREVMYIYSRYRRIYMVLKDEKEIYFYGRLDIVESEIKEIYDLFIRINKSYLVNINSIYSFKDNQLYIRDKNNTEVSISRKYKDNLWKRYFNKTIEKYDEIYFKE